MYVLSGCCRRKLVFGLCVISIGRWSELRACNVSQLVLLTRLLETVVMSGDVSCWSALFGLRVGVSVFSVR